MKIKRKLISFKKKKNLKTLFNKDDDNTIKIFDKEEEFKDIIYQGFMRFSYKFYQKPPKNIKIKDYDDKEIIINDLNETNYYEIATKCLRNSKYFKKIQDKIIKIISGVEINNIVKELYENVKSQEKGIDFISDIKYYMRNISLEYFIKFIYKEKKIEFFLHFYLILLKK